MSDLAVLRLRHRLKRTMDLTDALAACLDDALLASRLGDLRSNAIGDQFWCVAGARESYAAAIRAGGWAGFSCSLDATGARLVDTVCASLAGAARAVLDAVDAIESPESELLLDLLEHEAQHQGQLIRYFYANGIPFPAAFAERYALSE